MDYTRGIRRPIIALAFIAGLLLGWVILGWWLWPVEWSDADPWDLRPEHQAKYVNLVAEEYWQTKDVYQATTALAGWEIEALANLMAAMQCQACGSQESQQLAALAAALRLPASNALPSTEKASSLTSPLKVQGQPVIWGAVLSASMPVVAIAIIVSLRLLNMGTGQARKQQIEQQRVQAQQAQEQQIRVQQPGAQQAGVQQPGAERAQAQQIGVQQPGVQQAGVQQPGAEQPQAQQIGVQQPEAQQPQEQPTAQTMSRDKVKQSQDLLAQMQDRLLNLQGQVPEIQPAVAQMLEQMSELQEKMGGMTPAEMQERAKQIQEQIGQMQGLPEDRLPPEARAELARMQQQMAQVMGQTMVQMQQAAVQQAAVQQAAVQQAAGPQPPAIQQAEGLLAGDDEEEEGGIDLGDLDITAEDLASLFEAEEEGDPYLQALGEGLEDIDMLDLLEECKEVADDLERGNALVAELIRERDY